MDSVQLNLKRGGKLKACNQKKTVKDYKITIQDGQKQKEKWMLNEGFIPKMVMALDGIATAC